MVIHTKTVRPNLSFQKAISLFFNELGIVFYSMGYEAPSINSAWAAILAAVGVSYIWCAYVLFRLRQQSEYPAVLAAAICVSTALWIAVSIGVDRTVSPFWYAQFGRFTYVFPLLALYFFVFFAIKCPPAASVKTNQSLLFLLHLVLLIGLAVSLSPRGVIVLNTSKVATSVPNEPFYTGMLLLFVALLVTSLGIFIAKWRNVEDAEKGSIKILLAGLVASTLGAIAFSVWNARAPEVYYSYSFSYLSSIFFISGLLFIILRDGAFKISVAFKRSIIIALVIILAELLILL